jgi:hypothetical protein
MKINFVKIRGFFQKSKLLLRRKDKNLKNCMGVDHGKIIVETFGRTNQK